MLVLPESNNRAIKVVLLILLVLLIIFAGWIWIRLPVIKAKWPQIKAIWNNEINVTNATIRTEFAGLKLLMNSKQIRSFVGKTNFTEFATDIPEVTGINMEQDMLASMQGYDAWDEKGQGLKGKENYLLGYIYPEGKSSKNNPWIEKVNMEILGKPNEGIDQVSCRFFGDIFYQIKILYSAYYVTQVTWETFASSLLKAYNLSIKCPHGEPCDYPNYLKFNDGITTLEVSKLTDDEGNIYYSASYENNKIAQDAARAHSSHFPAPKP